MRVRCAACVCSAWCLMMHNAWTQFPLCDTSLPGQAPESNDHDRCFDFAFAFSIRSQHFDEYLDRRVRYYDPSRVTAYSVRSNVHTEL